MWVGDVDMGGIVEVGREVKRKLGLGSKDKIQISIPKEEMEEMEGCGGPILFCNHFEVLCVASAKLQ